jgi:hypothetical protein
VIIENKQSWFVALDDKVTASIIDELLGIKDYVADPPRA